MSKKSEIERCYRNMKRKYEIEICNTIYDKTKMKLRKHEKRKATILNISMNK